MPEFELESAIKFLVDPKSIEQVNRTVNSIKSMVGKALGAIGIGFSLRSLNQAVEEVRGVNLALESALGNIENMDEAQEKILRSSKEVMGNYEDMAKNVGDLVKNNRTLFDVDKATRFSEIMTKLTKLSGGSNADASSLISGLASMKNGKLDSGAIESLFSRAPQAIRVLTEYYGVSEQKLRMMAQSGIIRAQDIQKAFLEAGESVDEAFSNLQPKVTDVLSSARSEFRYFIEETDEMLGITKAIAEFFQKGFQVIMRGLQKIRSGLVFLTDKLGGTKNMLKLIGILVAALNFNKIIGAVKGLTGAFTALGVKGMLIVGIIALILLAVEDFVGFMQGKDSLIGRIFEKMGLDQDEMREKIVGVWGGIKDFFKNTFEKISGWFKENGPAILQTLQGIFSAVAKIFGKIGKTLKSWWDENGDGLMQKVGGLFSEIKDALVAAGEAIAEWWDQHGDSVIELICGAFEGLMELIDGTVQVFRDLWDILKDIFTGDWDGLAEDIERLGSDIWQTLVDTFSAIFDTELGQQFLEWGRDMIQKMVEGITQKFEEVKEVLRGASKKIKQFFHIDDEEESNVSYGQLSEEERNMIDKANRYGAKLHNEGPSNIYFLDDDKGYTFKEAGNILDFNRDKSEDQTEAFWTSYKDYQDTGEIDDELVKTIYQAKSVVDDLKTFGESTVPSAGTVERTVDSHDKTTNITQNVEVNNTFNGDRASQKDISASADKVYRTSTDEMAHALMYAR